MNQRQALAKASQYVSVWGHARGYTLSEPYGAKPESGLRHERHYTTFDAAQKAAKRARVEVALHFLYQGHNRYSSLGIAIRIYLEKLDDPDYMVDHLTTRECLGMVVRGIKEFCK